VGIGKINKNEKSKEETAFVCHSGLFQFNRMSFGLSNTPVVFQELMNIFLQGQKDFSLAYLDDILILSETAKGHLEHIQQVFDHLRQHSLKMKLKCSFVQEQIEYCRSANIHDGFNFAMFAIEDFSAKLNLSRILFYTSIMDHDAELYSN
jgi:hypothetical protein